MPAETSSFVITTTGGAAFHSRPGCTLLEAASDARINLPFSCETGRCGTCKCRVTSGRSIAMREEQGLTEDEKADGWILSCVRVAESDMSLEVEDLSQLEIPPVKTFPCRISKLDKLTPDTVAVGLRLPPGSDLNFLPGQYIEVIGPSGAQRHYSLASAGASGRPLELHIRAVPGGTLSEYWFNQARLNDLLRFRGPLGTFFLRDVAGTNLIFLATGTGIAPVKAILEGLQHISPEQGPGSVTVYWGGRVPSDLYLDVTKIPGKHRYVPVLSRAAGDWKGFRGHVQDVLLKNRPDLGAAVIYACGSIAMIRSAKKALLEAGLPSNRFFSDAFTCSAS